MTNDKLILGGESKAAMPPKKGNRKPEDVKILPPVSIQIVGATELGGGVQMMIIGLGNDNIMYTYHMQEKVWYDKL